MFLDRGEMGYGLEYSDSRQRMLEIDQVRRMIEQKAEDRDAITSGQAPIVLIARVDKRHLYVNQLPKPLYSDQYGNFLFMRF